ncbi:hypothetical protein AXYL_06895 (plasmid) [Achromobacter xylosoxidans A8]|uniref:ParB-like partition protein n=1 Tax=Achromobacter xylosoxidans (strain A8) TaxID=762376 RepID=E3HYM3_ACHXA|nr:hypothetical protein [Achromobacter xylosoxidans]ADP20177.1 hypothetical protein AXYL_06895 [Achromobacter xylosoxidans A8]
MARRPNLEAAVKRAAEATTPTPVAPGVTPRPSIQDRFNRAEKVLESVPTGYHEPMGSPELAARPALSSESSSEDIASMLQNKYGSPRIVNAPTSELVSNPYGARKLYPPQIIEAMANWLREDGQLALLIGTERDGRFIVIDGETRKLGAISAGLPSLGIQVFENVSDEDLYLLSFKSNDRRNGQTAIDNALAWRQLLEAGVFATEAALAARLSMAENGQVKGYTASQINKTLAILDLEEACLDVIRTNPAAFKISVLYELVQLQKVAPAKVVLEQVEKVLNDETSRQAIINLRERYAARGAAAKKPRHNSRQYQLEVGQGDQARSVGFIKEWDAGRVQMDITLPNKANAGKLVEELRKRLAELLQEAEREASA